MQLGDDATRFSAFYREHYSLILATCLRRLGDEAAAEDATAEVFRVAWQHFGEHEDPTLRWLYGVARHIIGNEYRRATRAKALVESIGQRPLSSTAGDGLEVREAMARLRPAHREILFMAYWEDLAASEIAEILGVKLPTVWVRLTRAREAFRRAFSGAHVVAGG